jgi:squalene-hopene/tetraprenyl-beta-curcumene cyclase
MPVKITRSLFCATLLAALLVIPAVRAAEGGPDPKDVKAVVEKAAAYLKAHQSEDGSFSARKMGPGVTALVVVALLQNGFTPDDPVVAKALKYLEAQVQKDGGIYAGDRLQNYTTSVALMALREANTDKKYDAIIKNASKYLKGLQFGDDDKDPKFGGVGYGPKDRPDLSNTQMMVDALIAAGVPKDDPAVQRALKFVSRCQNLPGETNDQPFAKKTTADDKGGLTYTPFIESGDKGAPNQTAEGGLRSLGAMTYGGLKSFLYAGVSKDDPRVQGAVGWIRRHYTLEENPGLKQAGLYYYYHTFAKALTALGEDPFLDADGKKHEWRKELFEALKKRQAEDGSFVNSGDRVYGENDPNLATAFALLSLSYTVPAKK